jgi:hypothetical protein
MPALRRKESLVVRILRPPSRTSPSSSPPGVGDGLRVVPASRQRSLTWVLVGLLLVVGGALIFAVVAGRIGQRQAVLAVAQAVPAGQIVHEGDLVAVRVSADPGLRPVLASARGEVAGRVAAVPLVPGTLLTEAALGAPSPVGPGEAVVGLLLRPGQFPPGLAAGARVLVAETAPDTGTPATPPRVQRATVVEVREPAADTGETGTVVAVRLAAASAPSVAGAGAAGRVVLVLIASEGP